MLTLSGGLHKIDIRLLKLLAQAIVKDILGIQPGVTSEKSKNLVK